jgi:peptidoglycan hydrolase-like protein with peptidoglycan-binding domain
MKKLYPALFIVVAVLSSFAVSAQGTFTQIHQILQTNCSGVSCHQAGGNPSFDVTLSDAAFYAQLVNVAPLNPYAANKFNKLVVPGDVQRSFLLRKLAHGISSGVALTYPNEGEDMPKGLPQLTAMQIELVRQWILFGARDTGITVDTALINRYYRSGGVDDSYSPHLPPPAGQGFQIYWGRVFVPPLTEKEYFLKYDPHLTNAVESQRIDFMSSSSSSNHHVILYNFQQGGAASYRDGIRPYNENSQMNVTFGIGAKPSLYGYNLPADCAYFFDQGLWYDLNLHIKNTLDTVLSVELYINVYTQPVGTAHHYMSIRNFLNDALAIPWDSTAHTYSLQAYDSTETTTWKLWQLYSHTHRYGLDFQIYHRNADGTKGANIYDGKYSYEHGFYQGYYGWGTDVTVETFPDDSLLEIDPRLGFIYEATYRNNAGPNPCIWGETSMNEMMVMGFQYIPGNDITGIKEQTRQNPVMQIFPNPSKNAFSLSYELSQTENVEIQMFNVMGEKSAVLVNTQQTKGKHSHVFKADDYNLSQGIYFVAIKTGDKTTTEKLIISK